jgi:hypothetical protein
VADAVCYIFGYAGVIVFATMVVPTLLKTDLKTEVLKLEQVEDRELLDVPVAMADVLLMNPKLAGTNLGDASKEESIRSPTSCSPRRARLWFWSWPADEASGSANGVRWRRSSCGEIATMACVEGR